MIGVGGMSMVKKLRKLRMNKGISQQRLAEVIGTSQQSINKYENHNVEPDISTLILLADYFQVSVDYLIGHTVDETERQPKLELDKDESCLVLNYRQLSKDEKRSIQLVQKNYLKRK